MKNNLIFCTKQTGDKFDNTGTGTINVSVLYYQLIDRDNADSSSYKFLYLMACTCIYADLDNIYLCLFNELIKGLSVIINLALHI